MNLVLLTQNIFGYYEPVNDKIGDTDNDNLGVIDQAYQDIQLNDCSSSDDNVPLAKFYARKSKRPKRHPVKKKQLQWKAISRMTAAMMLRITKIKII